MGVLRLPLLSIVGRVPLLDRRDRLLLGSFVLGVGCVDKVLFLVVVLGLGDQSSKTRGGSEDLASKGEKRCETKSV